mmetsp:Transcript_2694/g.4965  ORF Transcript_2694/g.4965 Transcript_2694/m.4965 type:complete len:238 (+) Transcript_2694:550-1263(+)
MGLHQTSGFDFNGVESEEFMKTFDDGNRVIRKLRIRHAGHESGIDFCFDFIVPLVISDAVLEVSPEVAGCDVEFLMERFLSVLVVLMSRHDVRLAGCAQLEAGDALAQQVLAVQDNNFEVIFIKVVDGFIHFIVEALVHHPFEPNSLFIPISEVRHHIDRRLPKLFVVCSIRQIFRFLEERPSMGAAFLSQELIAMAFCCQSSESGEAVEKNLRIVCQLWMRAEHGAQPTRTGPLVC